MKTKLQTLVSLVKSAVEWFKGTMKPVARTQPKPAEVVTVKAPFARLVFPVALPLVNHKPAEVIPLPGLAQPFALAIVPAPIAQKTAKAPRKPRKAAPKPLPMPSAAQHTTAPKFEQQPRSKEQLYKRAKRGDRYEAAEGDEVGVTLYRKVPQGKRFKYIEV